MEKHTPNGNTPLNIVINLTPGMLDAGTTAALIGLLQSLSLSITAAISAPPTPTPSNDGGIVHSSLGSRIGHARKLMGLTPANLAGKAGVSRETIEKYERDRLVPSMAMIAHLADILKCRAAWLETGTGEILKPLD